MLFLGAGTGWVAESVMTARQRVNGYKQTASSTGAAAPPLPPRRARRGDGLGRRRRHLRGVRTVHRPKAQLAAALESPGCLSAGGLACPGHPAHRLQPVSPAHEDTFTVSSDRETATVTVTGCGLTWVSPLDGRQPAPGLAQARLSDKLGRSLGFRR